MNKSTSLKLFVASFLFINLVSCSSSSYISSSYVSAFDLIKNQFSEDKTIFTRDQINKIPYASAILSFEGASQSLVILESSVENKNQWISSDFIKFTENDGRIIRTIGLPNDLYSIQRPKLDFNFLISKGEFKYIAYYSFRNTALNNLKVEIRSEVVGIEQVSIFGLEKDLILIEEHLYSSSVNWQATNKFWIDPESYYVWKSKQALTPRLPYLSFSVTKKPAL